MPSFLAATGHDTGPAPRSIAAADFNSDSVPDLVVASDRQLPVYPIGTVNLLLGRGDGSLESPRRLITQILRATSVVAGDFDSNGAADVIFADPDTHWLTLLRGNGDGTFQAPRQISGGHSPTRIAVDDFNGDGILDLVVTSYHHQELVTLQGRGDGFFEPRLIQMTAQPSVVTTADVNLDGNADLVVSTLGPNVLTLLRGRGDGTFLPPGSIAAGGITGFVAAGDFDADGFPDLVTTQGDRVVVLRNTGAGFAPPTSLMVGWNAVGVVSSDFNVDGYADFAVGVRAIDQVTSLGSARVFLSQGDGTFRATRPVPAGSDPTTLAVLDANQDGAPDLAAGAGSGIFGNYGVGEVSVLRGAGDGELYAPPVTFPVNSLSEPAVGDVNLDGFPDLVLTDHTPQRVQVHLGVGDGTFHPPHMVPVGPLPRAVAIADFDGDGAPDLAVTSAGTAPTFADSGVRLLRGNGDGTFELQGVFLAGPVADSVRVADFNGDALLDLVVLNRDWGRVTVLMGNGDGTFQEPRPLGINPYGTDVIVGDFNGDGAPDLAVGGTTNSGLILLGNGDGTFPSARTFSTTQPPVSLTSGDFNGDGVLDLASITSEPLSPVRPGEVNVLFGNGDGTFGNRRVLSAGPQMRSSLATADFNGDGFADLAVTRWEGVKVFLSDGVGGFLDLGHLVLGVDPDPLTPADLNGDGFLDLIVNARNLGRVIPILNGADWSRGSPSPGSGSGPGKQVVPPGYGVWTGEVKLELSPQSWYDTDAPKRHDKEGPMGLRETALAQHDKSAVRTDERPYGAGSVSPSARCSASMSNCVLRRAPSWVRWYSES